DLRVAVGGVRRCAAGRLTERPVAALATPRWRPGPTAGPPIRLPGALRRAGSPPRAGAGQPVPWPARLWRPRHPARGLRRPPLERPALGQRPRGQFLTAGLGRAVGATAWYLGPAGRGHLPRADAVHRGRVS